MTFINNIRDTDGDGLCRCSTVAIADLNLDHVIIIIGLRSKSFIIRWRDKGQLTAKTVDAEISRIYAAGNGVGEIILVTVCCSGRVDDTRSIFDKVYRRS